ncbi:hypothetical protein WJX81_002574 [Elliptochloris bilobata]|uniref:3-hydroxyisobutyrate dehydrogenase n=1 Tax=Elliptochloris bilobata TaxID=381761 RepID=A0AAW1RMJ9_9CHLO
MARNLGAAGYEVTVWNRTPERCEPLREAGAAVAATAGEAVSGSDITFATLSTPEAALAVGAEVAASIRPGCGYVDVSTVDAGTAAQISKAVQAAGGAYLEAPVSGSKGPAEAGQLIFLAGGDRALFERARPALDVMGKAAFYLGPVGAGAGMKLAVNQVMGTMMASLAEGLALAAQAGLSQAELLEIISLGAMANPMFKLKGGSMVEGAYPTAFPLKHQEKDLRLALELGARVGQPLPVAAAARQLYEQALADGHGDDDFSAVLEAVYVDRIE